MHFSPKDPVSMILTLSVIILFGVIKDGFTYFREKRSQSELNDSYVKIYDYGKLGYIHRRWSEVCVGDLI
jgi:hypothetical protein